MQYCSNSGNTAQSGAYGPGCDYWADATLMVTPTGPDQVCQFSHRCQSNHAPPDSQTFTHLHGTRTRTFVRPATPSRVPAPPTCVPLSTSSLPANLSSVYPPTPVCPVQPTSQAHTPPTTVFPIASVSDAINRFMFDWNRQRLKFLQGSLPRAGTT